MGTINDGKPFKKHLQVLQEEEIEKKGNSNTKLLAKAYEELSKGGLTEDEATTLKQLDKLLPGVELKVPSSEAAILLEQQGDTEINFLLLGSKYKNLIDKKLEKKR